MRHVVFGDQARPRRLRSIAALMGMCALIAAPRSPFGSGEARADTPPDGWTRARDPEARARAELHKRVREQLAPRNNLFPALLENGLLQARTWLEQARVEEGSDVVLLFDLGIVYENLDLHDKAIVVLERALRIAPDHPASDEAWLKLAFAYAKVDRRADEQRTYVAYLERASDPNDRSVALLNLAETEMSLGHLPEAIRGYREAMDHARQFVRSSETYVLGVWGLAVALDRYGDTTASAREAEAAARLDPYDFVIGNREKVFFVPAYERAWYLGLGAAARARTSTDPRIAQRFAQRAEAHFEAFVSQANDEDRWRALGEKRLATAKRERQRLEAKVRTMPRQRTPEQDEAN